MIKSELRWIVSGSTLWVAFEKEKGKITNLTEIKMQSNKPYEKYIEEWYLKVRAN